MREHSVFEFTCPCGREFQAGSEGSFRCPVCGRQLEVEWSAPARQAEAMPPESCCLLAREDEMTAIAFEQEVTIS